MVASNFGTGFVRPLNAEKVRAVKWIGGIMAGLAGLWGAIPEYILLLFWVAVSSTILDTITGCVCAWCAGTLKSRRVIPGVLVKFVQFFALAGFFACLAAVGRNISIMAVPFLIIIWVELVSNIENMYRLEKFGGVKFPAWARDTIARFAKGLQVATEAQTTAVVSGGLRVAGTPEKNHEKPVDS